MYKSLNSLAQKTLKGAKIEQSFKSLRKKKEKLYSLKVVTIDEK